MESVFNIYGAAESQDEFDQLFKLIFHHERIVAVKAIDAVEKITRKRPDFLISHKLQLFALLTDDPNIEVKWHLAQVLSRLSLSPLEFKRVWSLLTHWAINPGESKMVRVNSLQSLFDLYLTRKDSSLLDNFRSTIRRMERERVPSISARIRRLRKLYKLTVPNTSTA